MFKRIAVSAAIAVCAAGLGLGVSEASAAPVADGAQSASMFFAASCAGREIPGYKCLSCPQNAGGACTYERIPPTKGGPKSGRSNGK